MKYFASVVALIYLPKTLIWNKIAFLASLSLNLVKLVVNELMNSIFKKMLRFQVLITKEPGNFTKIVIGIVFD